MDSIYADYVFCTPSVENIVDWLLCNPDPGEVEAQILIILASRTKPFFIHPVITMTEPMEVPDLWKNVGMT
jgi:hypothetical protein